MDCIFCKKDSSKSKSIEHIVPESLGNKSHTLDRGIVCDKCNNYFAIKIERVVLESEFFSNLRFRNGIETKKRKQPKGNVLIPVTRSKADIIVNKSDNLEIILDDESFNLVKEGKIKEVYVPHETEFPKDDQNLSRLLAKIGLEMLAKKVINSKEAQGLFILEKGLDPIRNYARYNHKQDNWVYHSRRIYEEDKIFVREKGKLVDMLFECDFLRTEYGEVYFIIAIKGVEFVINMAGSSVEGYKDWLKKNNSISPLHSKGNNMD